LTGWLPARYFWPVLMEWESKFANDDSLTLW